MSTSSASVCVRAGRRRSASLTTEIGHTRCDSRLFAKRHRGNDRMTWLQVIVLAIVQGLTEFLPISSSGHLVLVPHMAGWTDQGLAFDVAVHFGSLLAVAVYFRSDLLTLVHGGWQVAGGRVESPESRMAPRYCARHDSGSRGRPPFCRLDRDQSAQPGGGDRYARRLRRVDGRGRSLRAQATLDRRCAHPRCGSHWFGPGAGTHPGNVALRCDDHRRSDAGFGQARCRRAFRFCCLRR